MWSVKTQECQETLNVAVSSFTLDFTNHENKIMGQKMVLDPLLRRGKQQGQKEWAQQLFSKGQIKPKSVWARHRFSQKTNERICFVCREKQKSNQDKFIFFVSWENLQHVNLLSVLSDL